MRPIVVSMHKAKTQFSKVVKRAAQIVRREPVPAARIPGLLAGRIVIKPGFDELPPGFEKAFASCWST